MSHHTGLVILLCWVCFFACIAIFAFSVKPTMEVTRGWRWSWLGLAVLIAALFWSQREWRSRGAPLGMLLWRRTPGIGIAADILALAGLAVAVWGRAVLGRNWNINPGLKEDHELIERGPYAYVRHPMYSGLCLMLLGTVIWFGNGIGFVLFLASLLGTWLKLREEEKLLTKHFGGNYRKYQARVKALIPWIF